MGKIKRVSCIATPMLLTVVSLVCFLVVALAQISPSGHSTPLERDLYFFKADTSRIMLSPQSLLDSLPDSVFGIEVPDALQSVAKSGHLKDFYVVGLFSYCEGETDTETGRETVTHCSAWKLPFYFDPVAVWQLENTSVQEILGEPFAKGMKMYRKTVEWTHYAFVVVLALTVLECVAGLLAIRSRGYSLCATIVSLAHTMLAIAAAAVATITYVTLTGVFESVLRPYNIEASLGVRLFSILWLAVACSIASSFFWPLSACFCSGK
ncbi:uncharacterized protein ALTATR162_LOCUS76 [Alternaria atra]|uniref:Integral membrane protein n=1 Tax=Alternaria atra TaxID=119953 RepID=A0A8J2HQ96_9PLEO|nr:uncharacterized protein ALTATR162_LOCUS76 [Alternaria atra]CAG5137366.1 unnamed protein product [Alternaria atra]